MMSVKSKTGSHFSKRPSGRFSACRISLYKKPRTEARDSCFQSIVIRAAGRIALAAVDRSVILRDERHASRGATLSAGGLVHFALLSFAVRGTAVLAGDAAGLAAGRLILEALLRIEFLLTGGEHKFLATVFAGQSLVLIHGIFPSEKNRDRHDTIG